MASSNRKPESLHPEHLLPDAERIQVQEMTSDVKIYCSSSSHTHPEQHLSSSFRAPNNISGTSLTSSHSDGMFWTQV